MAGHIKRALSEVGELDTIALLVVGGFLMAIATLI